jgi:putative ABC transport system permease protein
MLRVALRNLTAHKVRLLLTALAVVLGVSFVAGTFVFTDSLQRSFDDLFDQRSPDVVVTAKSEVGGGLNAPPPTLPQSLVATVRDVPGVATAEGYVGAQGAVVIGSDGEPVGRGNPTALGASWIQDDATNPFTLVSGSAPSGPTEVVLDAGTAERAGFAVGDEVRIVTPRGAAVRTWTVSGLAQASIAASAGGGTVSVFDLATAQQVMVGAGQLSQIRVTAEPGTGQAALRDAITAELPDGTQARTGAEIADETAQRLEEALGFLNTFLLAFALIALFVAAFLIFNTFSMLVAQRTRELALVRAVGASSRQVRVSVLAEAAVLALLASTLGLVAGLGLAQLLRLLFSTFGAELPGGGLVVEPRTFVATYVVGLGVTVLAAWIPAGRAGRVPPVAAMRTGDVAPAPRSLTVRGALGLVLLLLAVGSAVAGLRTVDDAERAAQLIGVSALTGLVAMIVLAPFVARPLVAVIGAPFRTATGRLAEGNARRSPRRTTATASALMIGVALMSALSVIASSATASIVGVIDDTIGADFVIFGSSFRPFPPDVYRAVDGTPGTDVVTYVRQTVAKTADGGRAPVTGVDPKVIGEAISLDFTVGSVADLALGRAAVDVDTATENGYGLGDEIELAFPNGTGTLTIDALYESAGPYSGFIVTLATVRSIGTLTQDSAVYITVAEGADADAVRADLEQRLEPFPTVTLQDQAQFEADIADQVNQVLGFLFALLALAVLIAFLGIVNTLLLSVVERTREIGLVRAIGATRPQVRRMVVVEAFIIAVFGALLGVALGLLYGALLQRVLEPEGFSVLAVPVGQLVAFVVLAGVGGVVAAVWPAWRASRLNMLRAIATE